MHRQKTLRTCALGHQYYKSSDCPVCPICEQKSNDTKGLLSLVSAPARRALQHHHIENIQDLAAYTRSEVLSWHGIGAKAMQVIESEMQKNQVHFRSTP